jgi:hypothetical protein
MEHKVLAFIKFRVLLMLWKLLSKLLFGKFRSSECELGFLEGVLEDRSENLDCNVKASKDFVDTLEKSLLFNII